MQFAEIPGLQEIKHSLVASFNNNHIAHAQLFNGPAGGGGLPMALAFATFLLCQDKQEADACGACANCQKMSRMVHPDVHYIYPKPSPTSKMPYEKIQADTLIKWRKFALENCYADVDEWVNYIGYDNKNVQISKEDSRQIIKTVSMKSFEGSFKILIVWYPELMHAAAANSILKVLEEPPTQTIYLLVSYAYDSLLATIRSRTQIFNIPPFPEEVIADQLTAKGLEAENARKISRMAAGSLGHALQEADHAEGVAYQKFQQWMQFCLRGNYSELVRLTEAFAASPKPAQRNDLEFSLALIRESLLSQVDGYPGFREGAEAKFISDFGNFVSLEALEKLYEKIGESLSNLQRNANAKITFLNLSLECSQLIRR